MSKTVAYRVRVLLGYAREAPDIAERIYRAQTPKLAEAITRRYYAKHAGDAVVTVLSVKRVED